MSRELKALGFVKMSKAQNEFAVDDFKKTSPPKCRKSGPRKSGGRTGRCRRTRWRWAKRGTRPSAPKDQRTKSRRRHLSRPWRRCRPGSAALRSSHAVAPKRSASIAGRALVVSGRLALTELIPTNITLLLLPPRSPELNPVENIWQFMRDNWLSNHVFNSYDEIVAISSDAWNKLIEQPWTIRSIGQRKWAHGFFNALV